jgi:amidophosphoribosyltransferase
VRSTTLRDLVKRTRDEGQATEVHVRIGAPPVIAPCFYGIDMSTLGELFAPAWLTKGYTPQDLDRVSREMATQLEADSLRYLSVADVAPSIGLPQEHLCTACVSANYPSTAGERIYQAERTNGRDRTAGRAYDGVLAEGGD